MRLLERAIPETLDDLVGLDKLTRDVRGWVNDGSFPQALLFHGPPGIGKTSAATVIAKTMLGEHFNDMNFIETNASDDRGIDFIRSELKFAMRAKSIGTSRKVVLLDEADGLTPSAQDAMRQIIEKYSSNAMLILTCNDLEKVRPAIRSRCKTYAFKPVSSKDGAERLMNLLGREWHAYWHDLDDLLRKLVNIMNGDMRACVMFLDGMMVDSLRERIELLDAMTTDDNALLAVKDDWYSLRRNLHALLDAGTPLHHVLNGFYRNMRSHFDKEVYPVLWGMMSVYGDVLVHKHTWSGDDYSYIDYMVAKMRKESESK